MAGNASGYPCPPPLIPTQPSLYCPVPAGHLCESYHRKTNTQYNARGSEKGFFRTGCSLVILNTKNSPSGDGYLELLFAEFPQILGQHSSHYFRLSAVPHKTIKGPQNAINTLSYRRLRLRIPGHSSTLAGTGIKCSSSPLTTLLYH